MASKVQFVLALMIYIFSVLLWGCVGLFTLMKIFLMGPVQFFQAKDHSVLPNKAKDPDLGTHDYVVLKTEKLRIKYVAKGERGKPLMLCVHGFPECWYSWRHQLKEFSNKYWVVAIDLPGYGDSDKPIGKEHYDAQILVNHIAEIIQELGYETATVVAHDWGGALVWVFAAQHSSMCDQVVIMNAPNAAGFKNGFSFKQWTWSWYMFFFQLPWIPEIMLGARDYGFLDQIFRGDNGVKNAENMTDEDVDVYKYALHSWEARNCSVNFYRSNNMMSRFTKAATGRKSGKISCPLLLIWGTEDRALTIGLAAKSASVSETITLEYVEGASHWVQQDQPEEVNKLMWNFLKEK